MTYDCQTVVRTIVKTYTFFFIIGQTNANLCIVDAVTYPLLMRSGTTCNHYNPMYLSIVVMIR